MTKDQPDSQSLQRDQGQSLLWQKLYEETIHSNRAAVDIGVFVLKLVAIVNGGALIALLAALGQFKDNTSMVTAIAGSAKFFFLGMIAAVLSAGLAYLHIGILHQANWDAFYRTFPNPGMPPPSEWATKTAQFLLIVIMILVTTSGLFLGIGGCCLIDAIGALSS